MSEHQGPKNGWWWKFVALFTGAPPIAVWGSEAEIEQERAQRAADDARQSADRRDASSPQ